MALSCENCNTSRVEITDIQITVSTIFSSIDVEMSLCGITGVKFCIDTMIDGTHDDVLLKRKVGAVKV